MDVLTAMVCEVSGVQGYREVVKLGTVHVPPKNSSWSNLLRNRSALHQTVLMQPNAIGITAYKIQVVFALLGFELFLRL